tara:strand:- start:995 stop:1861 length:867 start_codon:yes stop_codon:yes gene_type:complete
MNLFELTQFNDTQPEILSEGGSLPGVGAIHIDEINPTLIPLEKELGIDLRNNALGSVGKREFSGDIDVALKIDTDKIPEFVERLKKSKQIFEIAKSSVIMTKVKIMDFDENKDDGRPRTGYVQVDFMPGDPDWLKTYYHSPHEKDSQYKGVYRNLMIASIAGTKDIDDSEEKIEDGRPLQSKRFMFSPRDGLVRVLRRPVPAKSGNGYTKKNNNKIIAGPWKTADEIAKNLGLDNGDDLDSYETLVKVIKKNLSPEDQKNIFTAFTRNNTIQGMGIPPDIQEYSKGEL